MPLRLPFQFAGNQLIDLSASPTIQVPMASAHTFISTPVSTLNHNGTGLPIKLRIDSPTAIIIRMEV